MRAAPVRTSFLRRAQRAHVVLDVFQDVERHDRRVRSLWGLSEVELEYFHPLVALESAPHLAQEVGQFR